MKAGKGTCKYCGKEYQNLATHEYRCPLKTSSHLHSSPDHLKPPDERPRVNLTSFKSGDEQPQPKISRRIYLPLTWIPFIGRYFGTKYAKTLSKKEIEQGKNGQRYETFELFLQDLPEYYFKDNFWSQVVRGTMQAAGAEYQKYVLIDDASPEDKQIFVRKEKLLAIHDRGTYLTPWESQKKILYYDLNDCRPLIDRAKDAPWKNPDMCADIVTAITNTNSLLQSQSIEQIMKYVTWILYGLAILLIGEIALGGITQSGNSAIMGQLGNITRMIG